MITLRLVIANKNYSSWSMRPWVLMRQAGIRFDEVMVPFDTPAWDARIPRMTPSGQVPVLWIGEHGDEQPVWDSLAIAETLHELYPDARLWPSDPVARRHGRSIAAQMHADFGALRRAMPLNIGARLHGRGHTPEALHDLARIVALWTECRQRWRHLGPLLLGEFSIADAMYAPVVLRCETYGVELPPVAAAYADAVRALPAVVAWCEDARRETAFVAHDEPYRGAPERGSG
ncbi:MAG: glutathione S-transferase family protein [Nannocystaceae bacterium]|nr:glutathione S-transferase family protein [Nannocystaceae bacterium]